MRAIRILLNMQIFTYIGSSPCRHKWSSAMANSPSNLPSDGFPLASRSSAPADASAGNLAQGLHR